MTRRNKKQAPQPKKLTHRSSYINKNTAKNSVVVQGESKETFTGATIAGTKCKGYEQYYELMDPGSASAVLCHEKKTRTIMVTGGAGFAIKNPENVEEADEVKVLEESLSPGNVVEFPPGIPYRITATASSPLEFFVVQEKAYNAHLTVSGEATEGQEIAIDEVPETHVVDPPVGRRPRGMSKAVQQNKRFRGETNAGVHIARLLGSQAAAHSPLGGGAQATTTTSSHSLGVNPQPTNG